MLNQDPSQMDLDPEVKARVQRVEAAARRTEEADLWPRIELELKRRQGPTAKTRWVTAGFALAAFVGIAAIGLRPSPAYGFVEKMRQAVKEEHSVHEITKWRPHGDMSRPLELTEEVWYDNGSWRKTSPPGLGGDRIFLTKADGVHYYRRLNGKVADMHELLPQGTQFELDTLAPSFFPDGAKLHTTDLGALTWKGKNVEEIHLETADGYERMTCYLKAGTNLPVHLEKQDKEHGVWGTYGTIDLDFDAAIPNGIFDPARLPQDRP